MEDFSERAAFITGGAGGIGLAIARALSKAGVRVVIADIDVAELNRVASTFSAEVLALPLDTTDRGGWQAAKAAAENRFGPVDILVNNAGIGPDGRTFADMEPGAFDRLMAINLTGVFNGISAFAADMRARGVGHIVNTASMAGLMAGPGLGAYTAAKFAVVGMSEVLRAEMAPFGVGVSVLCPGLVKTRLAQTTRAAGSENAGAGHSKSQEGIDPEVVGARVVDAIRRNDLYILTHGEYRGVVAGRCAALISAFDNTPASGSSGPLPGVGGAG